MEHTIDATNQSLGRVASKVAVLLMGKDSASFEKHIFSDVKVTVTNASKIKMTEKKAREVMHERYSGYPGGFTQKSITQLTAQKGYGELFKLAIYGMLPANKLRPRMMKNLTVTE